MRTMEKCGQGGLISWRAWNRPADRAGQGTGRSGACQAVRSGLITAEIAQSRMGCLASAPRQPNSGGLQQTALQRKGKKGRPGNPPSHFEVPM